VTWQRLESTTVAADLLEGLEARVADPLWAIGRQWQVGELTGEDAASPLLVDAVFEYTAITRFQPGPPGHDSPVVDTDAAALPLETCVERESIRTGPAAVRIAGEAGLQLLRLLDDDRARHTLGAALRAAFPLELPEDDGLDAVGRAELELLARRSFDGDALAAAAAAGDPGVPPLRDGPAAAALAAWTAWYESVYSDPPPDGSAWDPTRMAYRFRLAVRIGDEPELLLEASGYTGGHLDWYSFDVRPDLPPLDAPGELERRRVRVVPTPARYAGQAAARWWQIEDADVWFGGINAAPEDLARITLAAFGTVFGRDWFLVPVVLPTGALMRPASVTVLDSFGQSHRIRACAELDGPGRVWRFLELTGDASADAADLGARRSPWLFLAPALSGVTESAPVEEVLLLRDEVANLGWGAELRVESAAGRVVDRVARARAEAPAPTVAAADAWLYQLATYVADYQVPLVPVRSPENGALYLQRGRLATSAARGEVTTRGAVGRILEPGGTLLINDYEVPETGVRVTRSWQLARTAAGGVVLWVGRRKGPAPPARSPGLVFDEVIQS
jgi:hypothetical protein